MPAMPSRSGNMTYGLRVQRPLGKFLELHNGSVAIAVRLDVLVCKDSQYTLLLPESDRSI